MKPGAQLRVSVANTSKPRKGRRRRCITGGRTAVSAEEFVVPSPLSGAFIGPDGLSRSFAVLHSGLYFCRTFGALDRMVAIYNI